MCSGKWQRQAVIVVETVQLFSKQLTNDVDWLHTISGSRRIQQWVAYLLEGN